MDENQNNDNTNNNKQASTMVSPKPMNEEPIMVGKGIKNYGQNPRQRKFFAGQISNLVPPSYQFPVVISPLIFHRSSSWFGIQSVRYRMPKYCIATN